MRKYYKLVIMFIAMAAVMYFNSVIILSAHEEVHKQVFRNYGIDSVIKMNYMTLTGITYPNMTEYNKLCNESCNDLNIQNEIVGYNIIMQVLSMWLMVIILAVIIFINSKSK